MARFSGKIGYGIDQEVAVDVWKPVITERSYRGDVTRMSRQRQEDSEQLNTNLSVSNLISIVADAFAVENFAAIRYVIWGGAYWTVADVTVEAPRLILRLGEVYNGPKAGTQQSPEGDSGQ